MKHRREIVITVWHDDISDDIFVSKVRAALEQVTLDTAPAHGFGSLPDGTKVEWHHKSEVTE